MEEEREDEGRSDLRVRRRGVRRRARKSLFSRYLNFSSYLFLTFYSEEL